MILALVFLLSVSWILSRSSLPTITLCNKRYCNFKTRGMNGCFAKGNAVPI